jgi:hypothetical protein
VRLRLVLYVRRVVQLGVVVIALAFCQSCQRGFSGGYLASHYEELEDLTRPVDASNVTRNEVKRTKWSVTGSWEFDSKKTAPQYSEWVTEKLKADFKTISSSSNALVFAKSLAGDTESIAVRLSPGRDNLHVRVEVSIVPD